MGFLGRDDPREVLRAVDEAEPLNPDHFLVLIRARLEPGRGPAILRSAIRREPDNVELWVLLSELERRAGNADAGRRAYERARELVPSLPPEQPPPSR